MPKNPRPHRRTHTVSGTRRRQGPRTALADSAGGYEIRVHGRLDSRWSTWFERVKVAAQDGETVISGDDLDQPKLRGMLNKIWDLNLTLISVRRLSAKE